MDIPSTHFASLFDSPVEVALTNGETRAGFCYLYFKDPGRVVLSNGTSSVVIPRAAILGIVATGPRDSEARPPRAAVQDLVDLLGAPVRVTLLAGGEWRGVLVDINPATSEFLGITRPDGSTVFVPIDAVATVEGLS